MRSWFRNGVVIVLMLFMCLTSVFIVSPNFSFGEETTETETTENSNETGTGETGAENEEEEIVVGDNEIVITQDVDQNAPRNTSSKLRILNGVETGAIEVTIKWGNTSLTNSNKYQYKIGDGKWQTSATNEKVLEVKENKTIYARFYDGRTQVGAIKEHTISQIDNEKPAEFDFSLDVKEYTNNTATVFATGSTTDNFGAENLRYEYKISSDQGVTYTDWSAVNEFKYCELDITYYVMMRAIDKSGNERVATNIQTIQPYGIMNDSIIGYIQSRTVDRSGTSNSKGVNYAKTINGVTYQFDVTYLTPSNISSYGGTYNSTTDTYTIGNLNIGTATNSRMAVLKCDGNLTITGTVTTNTYPKTENYVTGNVTNLKGLFIYCKGTLTNSGTISQTARGTYNTAGENVYLWKDKSLGYTGFTVPAVGAAGGESVSTYAKGGYDYGKNGEKGVNRATGGGASGSIYKGNCCNEAKHTVTSGEGGNGTSYSGGSGGGTATSYAASADADTKSGGGSSTGGAGGNAKTTGTLSKAAHAGAGTGNPGGKGANGGPDGHTGTGGLLILYANKIINNNRIRADGVEYHYESGSMPGGASGGGSINIFYENSYIKNSTNVTADGGDGMYSGVPGIYDVRGGDGSITENKIDTTPIGVNAETGSVKLETQYRLEVAKHDSNGNVVEGAGVSVNMNGTAYTLTTNLNGIANIDKLTETGSISIKLKDLSDENSKDQTLKLTAKKDKNGVYTLSNGSITNGKINFELDNENKVIKVLIFDINFDVALQAVNKETGMPLAGVDYLIEGKQGDTVVYQATTLTTDEDGKIYIKDMATYGNVQFTIEQKSNIAGSSTKDVQRLGITNKTSSFALNKPKTSSSISLVKLDKDDKKIEVQMSYETQTYNLNLTTVDKDDNSIKLSGANLELTDDDLGNAWNGTSSKGSLKLMPAVNGKGTYAYTLTETKAPAGYAIIKDKKLEIKVDETGKITSVKLDGKAIKDFTDDEINLTIEHEKDLENNTSYKVLIQTIDIRSGKAVNGIKFDLGLEADSGESISKSGTTATTASGKGLIELNKQTGTGQIRISLTETEAASGYKLDSAEKKLVFSRDKDGNISYVSSTDMSVTSKVSEDTIKIIVPMERKEEKNTLRISAIDNADTSKKIANVDYEIKCPNGLVINRVASSDTGILEIEDIKMAQGTYPYEIKISNPDAVKPEYSITNKTIKVDVTFDEYGYITNVTESTKDAKKVEYKEDETENLLNHIAEVTIGATRKASNYTLKLVKQDDTTGEGIDDVGYHISVTNDITTTIDDDKTATVAGEEGVIATKILVQGEVDVTLKETSAREDLGYLLDSAEKKLKLSLDEIGNVVVNSTENVVVDERNKVITVTEMNSKDKPTYINMYISKNDESNIQYLLGGTKIQIEESTTVFSQEYVSDETGRIQMQDEFIVDNLAPGEERTYEFTITELDPTQGYKIPDSEITLYVKYWKNPLTKVMESLSVEQDLGYKITGDKRVEMNLVTDPKYEYSYFTDIYFDTFKNEYEESGEDYQIRVKKTDSNTGAVLTDAAFSALTTMNIKEDGTNKGTKSMPLTYDATSQRYVADTKVNLKGKSEIQITETTVPTGYNGLNNTAIIELNKTEGVDLTENDILNVSPEIKKVEFLTETRTVIDSDSGLEKEEKVKIIELTIENEKRYEVKLSKYDPKLIDKETGEYTLLPGAEFKIDAVDNLTGDITGSVVSTTSYDGTIMTGIYYIEGENKTLDITETVSPQGYLIDSAVKYVKIMQDAEGKITASSKDSSILTSVYEENKIIEVKVPNTAGWNVIIDKKDEETRAPIDGAKFTANVDGTTVLFMPVSSGMIMSQNVSDIKDGTVMTLTETVAPNKYILDNTAKTITFARNSNTEELEATTTATNLEITAVDEESKILFLTVTNKEGYAIEVTKEDIETGTPIQGATFTAGIDGTSLTFAATDANGKVTSNEVAEVADGSVVTLTETGVPNDYILDSGIKTIAISKDATGKLVGTTNDSNIEVTNIDETNKKIEVTFKNKKGYMLEIEKVDSKDDSLLSGAEFEVKLDDGTPIVLTGPTDSTGLASTVTAMDLEGMIENGQKLVIEEQVTPTNYNGIVGAQTIEFSRDSENKITGKVITNPTGIKIKVDENTKKVTATISNTKTYQAKIVKYDEDSEREIIENDGTVTKEYDPVAGAEFNLIVEDLYGRSLYNGTNLTTDKLGEIITSKFTIDNKAVIKITETKSAPGFIKDTNTYKIQLAQQMASGINNIILEKVTKIDTEGNETDITGMTDPLNIAINNGTGEIEVQFFNKENKYKVQITKESAKVDAAGNIKYLTGAEYKLEIQNQVAGTNEKNTVSTANKNTYLKQTKLITNASGISTSAEYQLVGDQIILNIRETKAPKGYEKNETVEKIVLKENRETNTLTVLEELSTNGSKVLDRDMFLKSVSVDEETKTIKVELKDKPQYKVAIYKISQTDYDAVADWSRYVPGSKAGLSGAKVSVKAQSNSTNTSVSFSTTNNNGYAELNKYLTLDGNDIRLSFNESTAPAGYGLDKRSKVIYLKSDSNCDLSLQDDEAILEGNDNIPENYYVNIDNENNMIYVTIANSLGYYVEVTKVDQYTEEPLEGATFKIKGQIPSDSARRTWSSISRKTDVTGKTQSKTAYLMAENTEEVLYVQETNSPKYYLEDNETKEEKAIVLRVDENGVPSVIAGTSDGTIQTSRDFIDLDSDGNAVIKRTRSGQKKLEIDAVNQYISVIVENEPVYNVEITKISTLKNDDGSDIPVSGAKFTITSKLHDKDGNIYTQVKEESTNASGKLEDEEYEMYGVTEVTIEETEAPEIYVNDETTQKPRTIILNKDPITGQVDVDWTDARNNEVRDDVLYDVEVDQTTRTINVTVQDRPAYNVQITDKNIENNYCVKGKQYNVTIESDNDFTLGDDTTVTTKGANANLALRNSDSKDTVVASDGTLETNKKGQIITDRYEDWCGHMKITLEETKPAEGYIEDKQVKTIEFDVDPATKVISNLSCSPTPVYTDNPELVVKINAKKNRIEINLKSEPGYQVLLKELNMASYGGGSNYMYGSRPALAGTEYDMEIIDSDGNTYNRSDITQKIDTKVLKSGKDVATKSQVVINENNNEKYINLHDKSITIKVKQKDIVPGFIVNTNTYIITLQQNLQTGKLVPEQIQVQKQDGTVVTIDRGVKFAQTATDKGGTYYSFQSTKSNYKSSAELRWYLRGPNINSSTGYIQTKAPRVSVYVTEGNQIRIAVGDTVNTIKTKVISNLVDKTTGNLLSGVTTQLHLNQAGSAYYGRYTLGSVVTIPMKSKTGILTTTGTRNEGILVYVGYRKNKQFYNRINKIVISEYPGQSPLSYVGDKYSRKLNSLSKVNSKRNTQLWVEYDSKGKIEHVVTVNTRQIGEKYNSKGEVENNTVKCVAIYDENGNSLDSVTQYYKGNLITTKAGVYQKFTYGYDYTNKEKIQVLQKYDENENPITTLETSNLSNLNLATLTNQESADVSGKNTTFVNTGITNQLITKGYWNENTDYTARDLLNLKIENESYFLVQLAKKDAYSGYGVNGAKFDFTLTSDTDNTNISYLNKKTSGYSQVYNASKKKLVYETINKKKIKAGRINYTGKSGLGEILNGLVFTGTGHMTLTVTEVESATGYVKLPEPIRVEFDRKYNASTGRLEISNITCSNTDYVTVNKKTLENNVEAIKLIATNIPQAEIILQKYSDTDTEFTKSVKGAKYTIVEKDSDGNIVNTYTEQTTGIDTLFMEGREGVYTYEITETKAPKKHELCNITTIIEIEYETKIVDGQEQTIITRYEIKDDGSSVNNEIPVLTVGSQDESHIILRCVDKKKITEQDDETTEQDDETTLEIEKVDAELDEAGNEIKLSGAQFRVKVAGSEGNDNISLASEEDDLNENDKNENDNEDNSEDEDNEEEESPILLDGEEGLTVLYDDVTSATNSEGKTKITYDSADSFMIEITEHVAPAGYELDTMSKYITMKKNQDGSYEIDEEHTSSSLIGNIVIDTENNKITVKIINNKKLMFRLRKEDSKTGEGLAEAIYEITDLETLDTFKVTTAGSGDGSVQWPEKAPGEYYFIVREKVSPKGYLVDGTKVKLKVTYEEDGTISSEPEDEEKPSTPTEEENPSEEEDLPEEDDYSEDLEDEPTDSEDEEKSSSEKYLEETEEDEIDNEDEEDNNEDDDDNINDGEAEDIYEDFDDDEEEETDEKIEDDYEEDMVNFDDKAETSKSRVKITNVEVLEEGTGFVSNNFDSSTISLVVKDDAVEPDLWNLKIRKADADDYKIDVPGAELKIRVNGTNITKPSDENLKTENGKTYLEYKGTTDAEGMIDIPNIGMDGDIHIDIDEITPPVDRYFNGKTKWANIKNLQIATLDSGEKLLINESITTDNVEYKVDVRTRTITLVVRNELRDGLYNFIITKEDANNNLMKLPNAKFKIAVTDEAGNAVELKNSDGTSQTEMIATTNSLGRIQLAGQACPLNPGSYIYTITEMEAPTGYKKLNNPVQVKVTFGIEMMERDGKQEEVMVVKNAEVLSNADEAYINEYKNKYVNVSIKDSTTIENPYKLEIVKKDEDDDTKVLQGAKFNLNITSVTGEKCFIENIESDEAGKVILDALGGHGEITVEIEEIEAPEGYAADMSTKTIVFRRSMATGMITVVEEDGLKAYAIDESKNIQAIITNKKLPDLIVDDPYQIEITKTDLNYSDIRLSNAEFKLTIENKNGYIVGKTDTKGSVLFDDLEFVKQEGTYKYTIEETKAPLGYRSIGTVELAVTIERDTVTNKMIIRNVKSLSGKNVEIDKFKERYIGLKIKDEAEDPKDNYTLEIIKQGKDGEKLADAKFDVHLKAESGHEQYLTGITSDGNGRIQIKGLKGTGKIDVEVEETEAPNGYKKLESSRTIQINRDENTKQVSIVSGNDTVAENGVVKVTVYNEKQNPNSGDPNSDGSGKDGQNPDGSGKDGQNSDNKNDGTNSSTSTQKGVIFNKYVAQITSVNNSTKKTTTMTYPDTDTLAKVELYRKQYQNTKMSIVYNIRVTNNEKKDITLDNIVDTIPGELTISAEENSKWTIAKGKATYALNGITIGAGESKEVQIIMHWDGSKNKTGLKDNIAEIEYNSGKKKTDNAEVLISISTGLGKTVNAMAILVVLTMVGVKVNSMRKKTKKWK